MTVHAIVPSRYGHSVVDVDQLVDRLANGEDLEEAINNSGIDTVELRDLAEVREHFHRIRRLNETGDAHAYWHPTKENP